MKNLIFIFPFLIITLTLQSQEIKTIEEVYKNGPNCEVIKKDYLNKENATKLIGTWKAISWYVHEDDLLGIRNFTFTFRPDNSIKIEEKDNWISEGKWKMYENENILWLIMDENESSFEGRYDFENKQLIISGKGIIGSHEYCCIKMIKQES